MRLALILTKIQDEEKLDARDWNDLLALFILATKWLIQNTEVKVTQSSEQVHLQPKRGLKKKKSQR